MKIAVVDGQGGGIGKHLTEKLRAVLPAETEILALGTNAVATSLMLKAGANEGATGENAIVFNVPRVDVIVGTIGIVLANSMAGEVSPQMAAAVASSPALKLLLPLNRSGVWISGVMHEPLPHQIDQIVDRVLEIISEKEDNIHV